MKTLLSLSFFLIAHTLFSQTQQESQLLQSTATYSEFGSSVASAGDVNGDGFIDMIVGAVHHNGGDGRVYVYHGSVTGFSSSPDWNFTVVNHPGNIGPRLGCSVSSAGDVNGDGYDDVIVGAYLWMENPNSDGKVYVFLGSASGLSTTPHWEKTGPKESAFGFSVASAGDLDNDGYDDIVIGAPGASYSGTHHYQGGRAWVYYGSSTGVSTQVEHIYPDRHYSRLGRSVASAGDVNNDGYADLIVGEPGYHIDYYEYSQGHGRVRVYYGSSTGLDSIPDWTHVGGRSSGQGNWVSSVGDVNNDGFSDIVFTGGYTATNQKVYYGSSTGLGTSHWSLHSTNYPHASSGDRHAAEIGDINGDGYDDVISGPNDSTKYVFYGSVNGPSATWDLEVDNSLGANLGGGAPANGRQNIAGLGDNNQDGVDDFAIGAPELSNIQFFAGGVFVYNGVAGDNLLNLGNWSDESDFDNAYFGHEVANAGDVDGDGWDDLLVSAWYLSNGHFYEGAVFLYKGSSSGLSATPVWSAEGGQHNAFYGYGISTAGDVNNDGYADVIIGSSGYDYGQSNTGMVHVYHGSASGLSITPDLVIAGGQAQGFLGIDVANAGDVNGDGYDDVIIGAYQYSNPETKEGAAFIHLGSASGLGATAATILDSDQTQSWFGKSVSTAGDVNNDGYADVLVGAPKYDGGHTDEGKAYLYLGSASGIIDSVVWSVESNETAALLGFDVSYSGDNDNDGYDDIVIGAYGKNNSGALEGRVYGFYGSSSGPSTLADYELSASGNLNALGKAVAFAGDINHDGYDDILVGAESTSAQSGAVKVYQGSATGITTTAYWSFESTQTGAKLGASVSYAGDVNGDGIADFAFGAPNYSHGSSKEGAAFVVHGTDTLGVSPVPLERNADSISNSNLYPNPTSGAFTVRSSSKEIVAIKAIDQRGDYVELTSETVVPGFVYRLQTKGTGKAMLLLRVTYRDGSTDLHKVLRQ